jgi:hypothetical protein
MKTFRARGAVLFICLEHFFFRIVTRLTEFDSSRVDGRMGKGAVKGQQQLSTFVLTATSKHKKDPQTVAIEATESHNFGKNGKFIVALRSRAIYNLNNRFIASHHPRTHCKLPYGHQRHNLHSIHLLLTEAQPESIVNL